jgi:hypothetical protein
MTIILLKCLLYYLFLYFVFVIGLWHYAVELTRMYLSTQDEDGSDYDLNVRKICNYFLFVCDVILFLFMLFLSIKLFFININILWLIILV